MSTRSLRRVRLEIFLDLVAGEVSTAAIRFSRIAMRPLLHCVVIVSPSYCQVWAEKEMRNLKRLVAAGIPCPTPVLIKNNVLVMDFIGKGGWPAPRLRDVQLSPKKMKVPTAPYNALLLDTTSSFSFFHPIDYARPSFLSPSL